MDTYRKLLAKAAWDWLERKYCHRFMSKRRSKDRVSGRAEKRKARQLDRAEISKELA
jgi:hypothetical protein